MGWNSDGVIPIEEAFLDVNDLFGLRFDEGLVFLEVNNKSTTGFKPYEQLEDIESGTNLDDNDQKLTDDGTSNGDDILSVDPSDTFFVKHFGIGHRPWYIRRYTRYPDSSSFRRTLSNLDTPQPAQGSKDGALTGEDSPYSNPTNADDIMVPPKTSVGFDFFNPDNDSHQPILNIQVSQYEVNPLDPTTQMDRKAVKKILRPGTPIPIKNVGTVHNQVNFPSDLEWGVEPMTRMQALREVS